MGPGGLTLDTIQLDAPPMRTQLAGTITFGMEGDLRFTPGLRDKRGTRVNSVARELRFSGPLESPKVAEQDVSVAEKRP